MTVGAVKHWGVVGGGMLGLTLAHRLAQRGQRVTLCEATPQLGGLASAWQLGSAVWDRHYHVTLLSDTRLRALLAEIGLEDEMHWVETKTGFYSNGQLFSMSNSAEFLRFPPLNLWERLRLAASIFYASRIRNWRRLEEVPVGDWLRRWAGRGAFEKIWLPLLRAKLGETYKDVSAAFIWAHINRMYKARRTGMKREMFGYVPGGYARILERMANVLIDEYVDIRCGTPVERVTSEGDGSVAVDFADGSRECFDRLIFTVPAPLVARSCSELTADEEERFRSIRYLGIVCASLLLKKSLSPFYVTNITDSWVPLTAVIEMTALVDPQQLGGHHLVYLPKYVPAESEAFQVSDAQFEATCLDTLERMYPHFSRGDVVAFRVSRARHVMALPTLRYSERLPPMKTSIPGVYAINSAHIVKGNLNVNETIQIAEDAMSGVLAPELTSTKPTFTDPDMRTAAWHDEQVDRHLVTRPG